jgi:predicted nucleic acid-binding protein
MNTFIDTVAFYALADKTDKYNQRAKNYYNENYKPGYFITSSFVFSESWTLIHHKLDKSAARAFWEKIRSGVIFLQHVTPLDLERAWEIFNKYDDQDFSLVDCTSFAMMERLKIFEAFTFDSHFSIFRTKTNQAFICQPI